MGWRPRPSLQVPEARRADHNTVIHADSCKRHRGPGVSPSKGRLDVLCRLDLAPRDWAPLVEGGICRRGSYQSVDVPMLQWFETNVRALQHGTLGCHDSLQSSITPVNKSVSSIFASDFTAAARWNNSLRPRLRICSSKNGQSGD